MAMALIALNYFAINNFFLQISDKVINKTSVIFKKEKSNIVVIVIAFIVDEKCQLFNCYQKKDYSNTFRMKMWQKDCISLFAHIIRYIVLFLMKLE